jgi:Rieske Fe-S protein
MTAPLSRRRALTGAATLGVGVPVLAACGDDSGSSAADPARSTPATASSTPPSPSAAETTTASGAPAGDGLVAASDVPVGGGVILKDESLVVTQPAAGEFKAFSALCTHQGCLVTSVSDNSISCACHGSSFSAENGSVEGGPAPSALAEVAVTVSGDQVVKA